MLSMNYQTLRIMDKSDNINELAKALSDFQKGMKPIDKNAIVEVTTKKGGKYSFKYATLDNIVDSIREPLAKAGLSYSQLVGEDGSVTTILMHASGQYLSTSLTLKPTEAEVTPQVIGSVITYAKRYQLASILGLSTEDDDDANTGSGNVAVKTGKGRQQAGTQPQENQKPFLTIRQKDAIIKRIRGFEYKFITVDDGEENEWVFDTASEMFEALKAAFRIKGEWKDEIQAEINDPLNDPSKKTQPEITPENG